MATPLDLRIGPRVLEIISRLGTTVVFRRREGATYSPAERKPVGGSVVELSVKVSPPQSVRERQPEATATTREAARQVQQSLVEFLVPAHGLEWTPEGGQEVVILSETWRVLEVDVIRSGDLVAAYMVKAGR